MQDFRDFKVYKHRFDIMLIKRTIIDVGQLFIIVGPEIRKPLIFLMKAERKMGAKITFCMVKDAIEVLHCLQIKILSDKIIPY